MAAIGTRTGAVLLVLFAATGCGRNSDTGSAGMAAGADASLQTDRGTLEDANAMLAQAEAHYRQVGREQALADFTAKEPPFVDRDLYVFCYGPDRTVVAHGADASRIGVAVDDLRDVDGRAFGVEALEVAEAQPNGGRVAYKWLNPVTGEVEPKVSIFRKIGVDVCGVGAYERG